MKLSLIKTCLVMFLFVYGLQANADVPLYYWDNQEGLVEASHCSVTPLQKSRFFFSTTYASLENGTSSSESLKNIDGLRQSKVLNGSLVKTIQGPNKDNHKKIQVIAANANQEYEKYRWVSKRNDQGYLYTRSLAPVEDYVIEIAPDKSLALDSENSSHRADYFLASGDRHYQQLSCPEFSTTREYLLFDVYSKDRPRKIAAKIAVYWDETEIFSDIASYHKGQVAEYEPGLKHVIESAQNFENENFLERTALYPERDKPSLKTNKKESLKKELAQIPLATQGVFEEEQPDEDQVAQQLGTQNVVCIQGQTLNVRNSELDEVQFSARRGEPVKIFQGWDNENEKKRTISGVEYTFVRVQFSNREESDQNEGWVAENFISPKLECRFIAQKTVERTSDTQITGLEDPNCCEFPTVKRATHPYTSGMRRFQASRGGGTRWHAAADLYRYEDEPILSVAPGTIIRNRYYFYQGTFALEVVHSGGFVVRYGEITGQTPEQTDKGQDIKMGQQIGYMGLVNSGCCRPMLHFELYEGTKTGSLSQRGNKFQRRSDLMNPTPYLLRWEDEKF